MCELFMSPFSSAWLFSERRLTGPIFKPATDCIHIYFFRPELEVGGHAERAPVSRRSWGKRPTPPYSTDSPWKTIQIPPVHCGPCSWRLHEDSAEVDPTLFTTHTYAGRTIKDNGGYLKLRWAMTQGAGYCWC